MPDLTPLMEIAIRARRDALSIGTTAATLKASNTKQTVKAINNADLGAVFNAVQIALVERLCIVVARAYAPSRSGDMHLRRGFDLVSEGGDLGLGSDRQISALFSIRKRFEIASGDERCGSLKHYRNKFIAHYGRADIAKPLPRMKELYDFADLTADIMDDFAAAVGVIGDRYRPAEPYDRRDAVAFWNRWGHDAAPEKAKRTL